MKQRAFCEYCMKEQNYVVKRMSKTAVLNDEEISYEGKESYCNECKNEIFVNNVCRENLNSLYGEYKRKHNLIENKKIQLILKKYDISEEGLSIVLGLSKDAITRYLKGDMVSAYDSDVLNKAYESIQYYSIMLQTNKARINPNEYLRSSRAVKFQTTCKRVEKNMDAVIRYILTRYDDITPLILQKLLYYVQAFYYVFTDHFLFEEDCIAEARGPVFESVMTRYEIFGFDMINNEILNNKNLNIQDIEKNIVEGVLKFYGCYSGKILEKMVQNEAPWILTRKQMIEKNREQSGECDENINIIKKELISIYFTGVKEKYSMMSLLDMEKYSRDIFKNISF
ncbi:MAG: type II toxin-antitoxin system antitoxin SocA domain-containing protein [Clostridium sp.]